MRYLFTGKIAEPMKSDRNYPDTHIMYEIDIDPSEFPKKLKYGEFVLGPDIDERWHAIPDESTKEFASWLSTVDYKILKEYEHDYNNPYENWSIEELIKDTAAEDEYASEALEIIIDKLEFKEVNPTPELLDAITNNRKLSEYVLEYTVAAAAYLEHPGDLEILKAALSNPNLKTVEMDDETTEKLKKLGVSTYKLRPLPPPPEPTPPNLESEKSYEDPDEEPDPDCLIEPDVLYRRDHPKGYRDYSEENVTVEIEEEFEAVEVPGY